MSPPEPKASRPVARQRDHELKPRHPGSPRGERRQESSVEERIVTFLFAAGIPAYLAFEEGGLDLMTVEQGAIVLWWTLGLAVLFGFLPRARPTRAAKQCAYLFAAFAGFTALSLAWSDSDGRTFAELARVVGYGSVLALVWLSVWKRTWRSAAAGLAAIALGVCVVAIASRLFPLFFPDDGGEYRLAFPLGYWNALGAWGAMAVVLGLGWSMGATTRGERALALSLVPVAGLAVYLTYSRGSTAALIVGVVVLVLLSKSRSRAAFHALVATAGIAIAILVARSQPEIVNGSGSAGGFLVFGALLLAAGMCSLAALASVPQLTRRSAFEASPKVVLLAVGAAVIAVAAFSSSRIAASGTGTTDPVAFAQAGVDPADRLFSADDVRPRLWSEAINAWQSQPVGGIGPGTFELWWNASGAPPPIRDTHSLYLENLAELGPLGVALIVGFLVALLIGAMKARGAMSRSRDVEIAAGLIAAGVVFVVQSGVDWLWEVPAVAVLGLSCLAVAVAAASQRRRDRLPAWRIAAIAGVAVVAGAIQIPDLVSTRFERDSAILMARGDLDRALDSADDAVIAEPWDATPYGNRALVQERQGDLIGARSSLESAIDREPGQWKFHALLARVLVGLGDSEAGVEAFNRSAELLGIPPDELGITPDELTEQFAGS